MNRLLPALASLCTICLISACQSAPPASSIELPPLFSDNMVLQEGVVNTVWGTANPGGRVIVTFDEQVSEVVADAEGNWHVFLAPHEYGGPYEMHVIGQDTLTIQNLLVGDVWVASGQSNMEWPLRETDRAATDIPAANYPEIRLFTVTKTTASSPQIKIPSDGWHMTTPDQVPDFSAVAYYFGRTLYDSIDVPIGLIHSSWGGTPAEAWTSAETLKEIPDFKDEVEAIQAQATRENGSPQTYEERVQAWIQAIQDNDRGYLDGEPAWAAADLDDAAWPTIQAPQRWEEDALPDYDGIVWYRKTFDAPASWNGKDLTLNLAQIDDIDITWVNGVEVGRTQQYNQQRTYTIPASAVRSDRNVIAVRVLDTGGGGGIWGDASAMSVGPASNPTALSLAGVWRYQPAIDLKETSTLPARPSAQQNTPTMLYNAMIHPLVPYRIKGVIWYQGESNAGRAYQYRTLFPAMIQDWRTQWKDELAFYFVQLANFMELQDEPVEQETWPELREAQLMALDLPKTGMAVIIDIGEADDIHPKNKRDVGYRLAQAALHTTYGKTNVTPSGPLYRDMKMEQGAIRISFDYAGQGLQTPGNEPLKGFAIAGKDSVFHWSEAVIEGEEVVVSNPEVSDPVAVRYGWANNPQVNLYNAEGLPASPFRTDDWPGITEGNH